MAEAILSHSASGPFSVFRSSVIRWDNKIFGYIYTEITKTIFYAYFINVAEHT